MNKSEHKIRNQNILSERTNVKNTCCDE